MCSAPSPWPAPCWWRSTMPSGWTSLRPRCLPSRCAVLRRSPSACSRPSAGPRARTRRTLAGACGPACAGARQARPPAGAGPRVAAGRCRVLPADGRLATAAVGRGERGSADLERAARAGVIAYEGDRIQFAHSLFASTIYAEASPSQRRRLHHRLAELVVDAEERARHLALAADGPDIAVATALEEAAAEAHLRGAPDAAAALCEQAYALTPPDRPSGRRTLGCCRSRWCWSACMSSSSDGASAVT